MLPCDSGHVIGLPNNVISIGIPLQIVTGYHETPLSVGGLTRMNWLGSATALTLVVLLAACEQQPPPQVGGAQRSLAGGAASPQTEPSPGLAVLGQRDQPVPPLPPPRPVARGSVLDPGPKHPERHRRQVAVIGDGGELGGARRAWQAPGEPVPFEHAVEQPFAGPRLAGYGKSPSTASRLRSRLLASSWV